MIPEREAGVALRVTGQIEQTDAPRGIDGETSVQQKVKAQLIAALRTLVQSRVSISKQHGAVRLPTLNFKGVEGDIPIYKLLWK